MHNLHVPILLQNLTNLLYKRHLYWASQNSLVEDSTGYIYMRYYTIILHHFSVYHASLAYNSYWASSHVALDSQVAENLLHAFLCFSSSKDLQVTAQKSHQLIPLLPVLLLLIFASIHSSIIIVACKKFVSHFKWDHL
jgi:hypothetical protein